jgi:putative membrane protein
MTPSQKPADVESRTRTHLANERTYLAWFRTGITLIALGLAAAQFLTHDVGSGWPIVRLLASLLVLSGVGIVGVGVWRYHDGRTRIEALDFRPAGRSIILTSVAALITGLVAIAFVWLLRPV